MIVNKHIRTYLPALIPIVFFLGFSLLFYYSSPEEVIKWVGVENAYLLIFVLAFIGGLTTFSGVPYHIVLVALAVGGADPFFLGLSASFGVMLGDSTSYYVGFSGSSIVSEKLRNTMNTFSLFKEKHPKLLPVGFFLYGSLLPFSNDVITIPMGFLRYPFWRVMIPLGLGNIIFNTTLALLSVYAYDLLLQLPFF